MRRRIIVIFVLLALVTITGCKTTVTAPVTTSTESKFDIMVTGTTDTKFTGSYLVLEADGSSTSHSVEGTVPVDYTATGWIVSCVFQNKDAYGLLGVTIHKNGILVGGSSTSAAYGVVTLATP